MVIRLRTQSGLKAAELATIAGVHVRTIEGWLRETYPAIAARAKAEGAAIYWADETAVKEDAHWIRGFAPAGRTPVNRPGAANGDLVVLFENHPAGRQASGERLCALCLEGLMWALDEERGPHPTRDSGCSPGIVRLRCRRVRQQPG